MKFIGIATKTEENLKFGDVECYLDDYLEDGSIVRGIIFKENGIEVYYTDKNGADEKELIPIEYINCKEYYFLPQAVKEGPQPFCEKCYRFDCWKYTLLHEIDKLDDETMAYIEEVENWSEEKYQRELEKYRQENVNRDEMPIEIVLG